MNKEISNIHDIKKKLWDAANILRGNLSSEEYQHIIIGILSLKYISDSSEKAMEKREKDGFSDIVDDYIEFYCVYGGFKLNEKVKWNYIKKYANTPQIGEIIDNAFSTLEKENSILKGIFNKNYNREELDQIKLGEVVKIFADINFSKNKKEDLIGRIYEYFLDKFFRDRGKNGGEFYTPKSIVKLMVNLLNPVEGKIYDPACGTGGILIQAKKYIEEHHKNIQNVSFYGQEYNTITWKIAKLNLILHNIFITDNSKNCVLGNNSADTFTNDMHKDKNFEFIMANPPFNMKKWGQEKLINDSRWKWGLPPKGNANYAWLSHILSKLSYNGKATVVLANGSLSTSQKNEIEIRKNFIKENKVDAIIQLPDKLFFTTGIPACIWIFNNNKKNDKVLMISASELEGEMVSKKLRELTENDISKMVSIYQKHSKNEDINEKGFARTITKKEIEENDYSFVPGQYVEILEEKIDIEKTKEEIEKSFKELEVLFKEFNELQPKVKESIKKVLKDIKENEKL